MENKEIKRYNVGKWRNNLQATYFEFFFHENERAEQDIERSLIEDIENISGQNL